MEKRHHQADQREIKRLQQELLRKENYSWPAPFFG